MNIKLRVCLLFVLAMMAGAYPALSQEPAAAPPSPERIALIKDLFESTGGETTASAIIDSMLKQQDQAKREAINRLIDGDKTLTPAQRERLSSRLNAEYQASNDQIRAIAKREITTEFLVVSVMVPVYSKYYTDEELKSLVAFFKTPIGHKMVRVTPQVMNETMKLTSEALLPKVYPEIEKVLTEQQRNIEKIITEEFRPKPAPAPSPGPGK